MSDGFAADGFIYDVPTYEYESMLTKEDGSIVEDADTFCDIADVETYATRYGFTFSAQPLEQEQAILRAMIYMESLEGFFYGSRVSASQELSWPRSYVPNALNNGYLPNDEIPKGVKNALSEAAIAELSSPGSLTATVSHASSQVKRTRDKLGPMETEIEYFGAVSLDAKTHTRILEHLRPYFRTGKSRYSVRGH